MTVIWPAAEVAERDLGPLVMIGSGGEGVVYSLPDNPGFVYKRYQTSETPNVTAVSALMTIREAMTPAERSLIDATCAWPTACVVDAERFAGFIMLEAEKRFSHVVRSGPAAGKSILVELQHLIFRDRSHNLDVPVPRDRMTLLLLCVQWAEVIELLHRYDVVVGDVSPRNLLWSLQDGPSVFVLDCDSFRRVGNSPVLRSKQTPDWDDPHLALGAQTNLLSDRYKLALIVLRCLAADPRLRPESPGAGDVEATLSDLVARSAGSPDGRPTATDWVVSLRSLVMPGRPGPTSGATPPRAQRPSPQGTATSGPPRAKTRPVLDLTAQPGRSVSKGPLPSTIAPPVRPILDVSPPESPKDKR